MKNHTHEEIEWPSHLITRDAFVEAMLTHAHGLYRDLPWRNICDPYEVLVSEIMLQQTQVARVEKFWRRFLESFPTLEALAAASVSEVVEMWQGLGYNRRALALKKTAETCVQNFEGTLPQTVEELRTLPGIGPATAAGVVAFAYEKPAVYLETNVRTVFLHELFPHEMNVPDKRLEPLVALAAYHPAVAADPRRWYYGLLDYGAHLKATMVNPSRRSAHHTRQSTFEGSRRQKRSFVVRTVLAHPEGVNVARAHALLNNEEKRSGRNFVSDEEFSSIVNQLAEEGFFTCQRDMLIPS
jgi:A/G-specific adenine glycosylase